MYVKVQKLKNVYIIENYWLLNKFTTKEEILKLLFGKHSRHRKQKVYEMTNIREYEFSRADGRDIVQFAREALETYVREGQKMDIGSVNDLLNMRGGILLELESDRGMRRLRGSSSAYAGSSIADSVIQSTVYAASSRSVGSEISYTETKSVIFKISAIEGVKVVDNPRDSIQIGRDVPILTNSNLGWIFPSKALERGWTEYELLNRTCKKAGVMPNLWKDKEVVVLKTRTFVEETPSGRINTVEY